MKINADDLNLIKKYKDIMSRGYYANGREVCELYNRVLEKNAKPTNCSSCIRRQISELVAAAKKFEELSAKLSEESKAEEPTVTPQEENKEPEESKKKPTGRKKKTE